MGVPLLIRDAERADLPQILDIYNEVIANTTAVYSETPASLADRENWWRARVALSYPVLVGVDTTGVVGFSSFGDFRSFPCYAPTVEHSVHIRADRRGAGLGAQLVRPLFGRAAALDKHTMIAGIDAQNEASIRMHAKLGFDRVALFTEVGKKFGRWLDLVFMQRRIDVHER
jgi:phosphinothricin acetyltransferase